MARSMATCLVLLFCLCAGVNAATSVPVFFLDLPPYIYLTCDGLNVQAVPRSPAIPAFATAGKGIGPNRTGEDPQDPEDPDPQPSPVRPDMQGDLSGKDKDPPPPPP